ncbi:MAG: tyrosine-type recombinase/integrase [Candidatus Dojkabacteria bacterium]
MNNEDLINKFIEYLKRKGRSESTLIAYKADIIQLSHSSTKNLINSGETEINSFLKRLKENTGLTPKTISRKLNSIKTFYKFLELKNLVNSNPTKELHHPKFINAKPKFLNKDQYQRLKDSAKASPKNFMMLELMLQTGMRISEVSNLKIKDVDLNRAHPRVEIRDNKIVTRQIPLNDKIFFELKDYISSIGKSDYVFTTKNNKPIEVRNIRAALDRVFLKVKLQQYCVNDLRNTFIVTQLSNGMKMSALAKIVGHKSPTATERYVDILSRKYKDRGIESLCEL